MTTANRFSVSVNSVGPFQNRESSVSVKYANEKHNISYNSALISFNSPTFPSLFTKKKSLNEKIRFMHKFSANLNTRWSPRFPLSAEIIFVTSYIKALLLPWYLESNRTKHLRVPQITRKKHRIKFYQQQNRTIHQNKTLKNTTITDATRKF